MERRGVYRVPRRQEPLRPDLQLYEVRRGTKPGSRYVRITPSSQQPLKRMAPAYLQATAVLLRPRTLPGQIWSGLRRVLIGSPLATSQAIHERLDKVRALAIFSSDALSSSAYATEEILLVLILAGSGALNASLPIAAAITALLITVAFSYRQTVRAYPGGGGSYTVAKENLGVLPGLVAASALMVDYVLTVAVSVSAGVAAITSAAPALYDERVLLAVLLVSIIVLGNLRGVRESGNIFSIPTYLFIVSFGAMLVTGFIRYALGAEAEPLAAETAETTTGTLTVFLVLRAFSSGSAALTGIEAMANGVPAFKPPESKNAATTLVWMAAILATFFLGLTALANLFDIVPVEQPTVVSQIGKTAFGETPPYYVLQVATMLILLMATNGAFAGFPRLASVMAMDRFLPYHMTFRGDRLAFSTGIFLLGLLAGSLLVIYQAETHRLIPLYAVGVFICFSLSQTGMVRHWLRSDDRGRKRSMIINGIGAAATATVAVIIAASKFTQGAWMVLVAIPILVLLFQRIHHHYTRVSEQLAVRDTDLREIEAPVGNGRGQTVIVPVDGVNRAVLRTVDYARSLSDDVTAVHVTDDLQAAEQLRAEWEEKIPDVPIVIVESPYRALVAPFLAYIDAVDRANPNARITVVLPEFVPVHVWQGLLHNQPALRLKRALLARPNTAVVDVLYHLR
ncbi:MAG: APC family permease [Dehalococcoidia bacterium]|nr:APC family permease [Dehalococcoidia bacterium]